MASSTEVVKKVEQEVKPIVTRIKSLVIKDNVAYAEAGEILTVIKNREKDVKARKEEITKPLNAALTSARALFKPVETDLADAKSTLLSVMGDFKRKQDAIAAEKARKLQEKIEKGTIKNVDTIMRNVDAIEKADDRSAGIKETTRKVVTVPNWDNVEKGYIMELLRRSGVETAVMVEIRKDALGNKAAGIDPRIEAGVVVTDEKSIY